MYIQCKKQVIAHTRIKRPVKEGLQNGKEKCVLLPNILYLYLLSGEIRGGLCKNISAVLIKLEDNRGLLPHL